MPVDVGNKTSVQTVEKYVLPILPPEMLPLHEYDEVHVCVSGGVDSVVTALLALHGYHIPKHKIKLRDVYNKWVRQFNDIKILLLTGERSEESTERAEKPVFKIHSAQATGRKNRILHWLKPIKDMLKFQVRELVAEYGIELHPCYEWVSRCSCKFCIFNTSGEMQRTSKLYPDDWEYLKKMELDLGHTMKSKKGKSFALGAFIKDDQIPLFD
ncbi:phosphoadenosine phosphosulfate reductase family protein [Paenibacillus agricola]|uniref:Phosphoadenosine phosphosulfate reductase family protein n=1 Tax=Paenibacillus agricola TaxID=2716264 RepID=A0ABX0JFZ0_9BACL|nr:phosphoadenosine phosphosulfate reductase family protein [Paenibacillus agricola]NHN35482.1 phosphoadenosine phosphosulfate reductase family protein [Paenibacillus agricola]